MKKLFLSLITVLSVGFFISSCSFPELPSPELTFSQAYMKNVAVVNFITDTSPDESGVLVESLEGTAVSITGPDAAKVFNLDGTKDFKITGGMVALLLDPSAVFSGNMEFNINVEVAPVGYLKRIIPVKFIKDQNDSSYEVVMLKKTDLPAGISMNTNNSGTVAAGAGLGSNINLTASNATVEGVTTSITVPAGIKMKDASNATLAGKLDIELISFSETGTTTAYFPGGLAPENIDMGNGQTASGTFVSAGFASINMSVGGNKVKTFEGGKVAVKMTLSKVNYNPITEKPYTVDDKIDIWSYDDDKGQWKFESTGTVKKDTDNSLYVAFETTHLSSFNLDYFNSSQGKCNSTAIQFDWTSDEESVETRIVLSYMLGTSREQYFTSYYTTINKGQKIYFWNAPLPATSMRVYNSSTGKLLLNKNFAKGAFCANPTVNLDLAATAQKLVTLNFEGMCVNTGTKVLPPVGTTFYYKETGTVKWRKFYVITYARRNLSNLTTRKLTVGKSYDFYVIVGNKKTQKTYTIERADYLIDVPLPASICNSF